MDRLEALHTTMHGDGPGRLSVAVPTSQARNHPGRPGEAQHGMGVFLPCGIAFQRRVERTQAWRFPLAQTPCWPAIRGIRRVPAPTACRCRPPSAPPRSASSAARRLPSGCPPDPGPGIWRAGTAARWSSATYTTRRSAMPWRGHPPHGWSAAASAAALLPPAHRPRAPRSGAAARCAAGCGPSR
jgi:hypothetical protein